MSWYTVPSLLSNGSVLTGIVLNCFDFMNVSKGGIANNTIINSGASLTVYSGGTANDTIINSYGSMVNDYGAVTNNTTVNHGGHMVVYGTGARRIKENGGWVQVTDYYGASASFVPNALYGLVLSSNDVATAHSGTTMTSTWILCGCLEVCGGSADLATIDDGLLTVVSGGKATSTTVNNYGDIYVSCDGLAQFTTINSGGRMTIYNGGIAHVIEINSGGSLFVANEGTVYDTTINSGAVLSIGKGETLDDITVNPGGILKVEQGGTALLIKENGGYVYGITGYDNRNVTFAPNEFSKLVLASASATVNSGTTATATVINNLGEMYVYSGGTANDTSIDNHQDHTVYYPDGANGNETASYGRLLVKEGGTVNHTNIYSGGEMCVYKDATANDTTINDSGFLYVYNGGIAAGISVNPNGQIRVYKGGTAKEVVENGGAVYISSGANVVFIPHTIRSLNIQDESLATLHSGTVAVDAIINSGGSMEIFSAGQLKNINVKEGGGLYVSSGGKVTGKMEIYQSEDTTFSLERGAIIDFDISCFSVNSPARINNLPLIGGPIFTITVSASQTAGCYTLADSLSNEFLPDFTICTTETNYGTIEIDDEALRYENYTFKLVTSEGKLLLIVDKEESIGAGKTPYVTQAWAPDGSSGYVVEYSTDNFQTTVCMNVFSNAMDTFAPPTECQWRARSQEGSTWTTGNVLPISDNGLPQYLHSIANGVADVFFAQKYGTWEDKYSALHLGSVDSWQGTNEEVSLFGKNKLADIIEGSEDANLLLLTDDSNGDALFVDDTFSSLPVNIFKQQSRLARIDEIRAGDGNDIVDLTSQQFTYVGNNMTVRGGLGDDIIWANNGNNNLFGDAGNDRIVGASGNDLIVGGAGNDSLHGGGGNDIFVFGGDWGHDSVEQLIDGKVTLWFAEGSEAKWNHETLTYIDGDKSVKVTGVGIESISLKFGDEDEQYTHLLAIGAFNEFTSEKIFEVFDDRNTGILA
ncbi:MAG: AIDA repeat-containing protein [Victivallales bacterium]|nr:AIDA repeat-containing protein [Victivallales bacterium]